MTREGQGRMEFPRTPFPQENGHLAQRLLTLLPCTSVPTPMKRKNSAEVSSPAKRARKGPEAAGDEASSVTKVEAGAVTVNKSTLETLYSALISAQTKLECLSEVRVLLPLSLSPSVVLFASSKIRVPVFPALSLSPSVLPGKEDYGRCAPRDCCRHRGQLLQEGGGWRERELQQPHPRLRQGHQEARPSRRQVLQLSSRSIPHSPRLRRSPM